MGCAASTPTLTTSRADAVESTAALDSSSAQDCLPLSPCDCGLPLSAIEHYPIVPDGVNSSSPLPQPLSVLDSPLTGKPIRNPTSSPVLDPKVGMESVPGHAHCFDPQPSSPRMGDSTIISQSPTFVEPTGLFSVGSQLNLIGSDAAGSPKSFPNLSTRALKEAPNLLLVYFTHAVCVSTTTPTTTTASFGSGTSFWNPSLCQDSAEQPCLELPPQVEGRQEP
jgi:hypothetical protein